MKRKPAAQMARHPVQVVSLEQLNDQTSGPSLPLLQPKEGIFIISQQSDNHLTTEQGSTSPNRDQDKQDEEEVVESSDRSRNMVASTQVVAAAEEEEPRKEVAEDSGREKLRKHRLEVAGRVWIPDIWGQEEFLKDWVDCTAFDDSLFPNGILSARSALVEEGRRGTSSRLRIENSIIDC